MTDAKTELTAEELAAFRRAMHERGCGDPDCDGNPEGCEACAVTVVTRDGLRLLDEHAAQKTELASMFAQLASAREQLVTAEERVAELYACAENNQGYSQMELVRAEQAEAKVAELESALALATEAVAAEARATIERVRKVLVRYAGKTGIHRGDIEDALDPQSIPEMPLAKGDGNG